MVNRRLLELLVCPVTRSGLRYNQNTQELLSDRAKLAYPIRNGVPFMLSEYARAMDDKEVKK